MRKKIRGMDGWMDELTLGEMDRDNQFDFIILLFILNLKDLIRNLIFI
jgi:hypothetical protein